MENSRVNIIRQISRFIEHAYVNEDQEKWHFFFRSYFNQFYEEIQGIYQDWFPLAKHYIDDEITDHIFKSKIERKELKTWIKYEWCAMLTIVYQLHRDVQTAEKRSNKSVYQSLFQQLTEVIYEISVFFEFAHNVVVERANKFFGDGKKSVLDAREVHTTHDLHLRKTNALAGGLGKLNPRSEQVVLLRESMKKWIKDVFGINYVTDLQGNVVKLEAELLFNLIDSTQQSNSFPVDKNFIKLVYAWTTPDLQARILAYTWEIEWAKKILQPLFDPQNISLKVEFYDNIQQMLKDILQREDILLHRIRKPEAMLIG
ncbi:hypothetical protein BKI52_04230 [marine bacterium AO1-C]|nr:hypothetical protein BKI52_04230 [marine bacterium AO1-C]